MKVHAYDRTIKDIFSPQNTKYIVPRFQREFSWTKSEVLELWHDTISCIKNENSRYIPQEYFIGSLVLVGDNENLSDSNSNEFSIVDGQQRLTTITIFLSALIEALKKINEESVAEGLYNFIEGRDLNNNRIFKLINETPKPFFQKALQNFNKSDEKPSSDEEKRLIQAYHAICNEIRSIKSEHSDQEDYIKYLKSIRDQILNLKTIFITVDSEVEAYTIFETLNARGINLTTIDLIKNTLFRSLDYSHPDDDAKTIWKKMNSNLSERGTISLNVFFRHYWLSKYQFCREVALYKSFKQIFEVSRPPDEDLKNRAKVLLQDLETESNYYKIISNPSEIDWRLLEEKDIYQSLIALRLFNVTQVNIILLALYAQYKDKKLRLKEFAEAVQFLENFHFLYSISLKKTSSIESKYSKHAREIRQASTYSDSKTMVKKMILDFNEKLPKFEVFLEGFQNLKYYKNDDSNKKIIQYIFKRWEKYLQQTGELDPYKLSIEHIYPQTTIPFGGKLVEVALPEFVGKIGNLLPLSQQINIEADTKSFSDKIEIYKKSEFKIVSDFVQKHGTMKEWNEAQIEERTKEMAKLAYNTIWRIKTEPKK